MYGYFYSLHPHASSLFYSSGSYIKCPRCREISNVYADCLGMIRCPRCGTYALDSLAFGSAEKPFTNGSRWFARAKKWVMYKLKSK